MNRQQFLQELNRLLFDVPDNERVEALNFYNEYFNDAGPENEQQVIRELESPQKVADSIREGLRANADATGTTGSGANSAWQSGSAYQNGTSYQGSTVYQGNTFYQSTPPKKEGLPAWAIVLIIIACIICSPVLIGVACGLLGLLLGVFSFFFGLVVGFGTSGIALFISGLLIGAVGIYDILVSPFAGLILIGIGLILLALGILFIMFTVWLCGYAIPALCRGISWLWKKLFVKTDDNNN